MSVLSIKTMKSNHLFPTRGKPWLAAAILALLLGPAVAGGWQAPVPLDQPREPTTRWSIAGESDFQIEQIDEVQTFRVQTTDKPADGAVGSVRQFRVLPGGGQALEVESFSRRIQLPGNNAIEVFSGRLSGRGTNQIVVEMKKVRDSAQGRSIGYFAPESWIESRNGQVKFLGRTSDDPDFPSNQYWIGVRCQEVATELSEPKEIQVRLVVEDVVPQSAAEQAGIQIRDQLVSWNQKPLESIDDLVATIQANRQNVAHVELLRDGQSLEVQVTPDVRSITRSTARTVIVPTASLQLAQQKIQELKKLVVHAEGDSKDIRVLLVGPGVNFGQQEIELQVDQAALVQHAGLRKVLDRVADKKFGLFIKGDSFTVKSTPDEQDVVGSGDLDFEPHEIWETMQLEVNGKKIAFQQLVPRIIERQSIQIRSEENEAEQPLPIRVQQLQTGQIAFPNPFSSVDEELQDALWALQRENERIRQQNQQLQAELRKLKQQLQDPK